MVFIAPNSTHTTNPILFLEHLEDRSTLIDLLRYRSLYESDKQAYTFLKNGETELITLTYRKLDLEARKIAVKLESLNMVGERALLLYHPGIEFITAFFGCLYAQVIGVPLYPPKRNQNLLRIQSIVNNCGAKLALTTQDISETIEKQFDHTPDLAKLHWIISDHDIGSVESTWEQPKITSDSLAFLQYTSGSTGTPKGVMVSHKNLLVNSLDLDRGWQHNSNSVIVSWLPTFHDLGLIYGVLQPLYKGIPCYLMAPASFLQTPVRWLQAITRYKGTHSAAPNFAYELCARKITPEQRETLDLSSWQMALNGAEPIRPEVLKHFSQVFEPCGFNPTAFCPGYGLAEATLKVSAVNINDKPTFYQVQADALQQNKVITAKEDENQDQAKILVGCGFSQIDTQIVIVNPDTLCRCASDEVGEIWVSGATVAQGYWQRLKETQETFHAYLSDTQEGPFLRTGDLGFIREDGELFITGRLKDFIIIRGRNHYPQDIELTLENTCIELIPHRSAAFTIDLDGQEKLVVAAEVERRYHDRRQKSSPVPLTQEQRKSGDRREEDSIDLGFTVELSEPPVFDGIVSRIKQAVSAHHGLQVYRVLLLRVGTIPKTSSGKIQRYACRQGCLEGTLNVVYDSHA